MASADTFSESYECEDCGRDDYLSISAMMSCPCWKIDLKGRSNKDSL